MSGLYISATRKSSGKTTFATGLCAALSANGLKVQPFKKGPDYIDPMWLTRASGRTCINLDFQTMTNTELNGHYDLYGNHADINIVEGNKGLFDGVDIDGADCNAALAQRLQIPVILVVDCTGMTRGVAAMLKGYQNFEPQPAGIFIVLNNLGGSRHEEKVRKAIEQYTDFEVVGALQKNARLQLPERHLGLVTTAEFCQSNEFIDAAAAAVASQTDLSRLREIANQHSVRLGDPMPQLFSAKTNSSATTIGIARDKAFGFYYADDIDALHRQGVQVEYFDTLNDTGLPNVDALFIGGGFPEVQLKALARNTAMHAAIRNFIATGKPVYAECGGLMYLSRSISWQGICQPMIGAIPADIEMHQKPVGRGYVTLLPTPDHPWSGPAGAELPEEIHAHEFHYSSITNISPAVRFAYNVKRGYGVDGHRDGLVMNNVFGSYAHLRHTVNTPWTKWFLRQIDLHKLTQSATMNQVAGIQ